MSVTQHGSISYTLTTLFFLSFILALIFFLMENISIIIFKLSSEQIHNFILDAVDVKYAAPEEFNEYVDDIKEAISQNIFNDFFKNYI